MATTTPHSEPYPEADLSGIDYDAIVSEADAIKAESDAGCSEETLAATHAGFAEKHSHLFKLCCRPGFDRVQLLRAVNLLKGVQDGKISKRVADEQFGKELFEKFGPATVKKARSSR
jgi:hypothetical protein